MSKEGLSLNSASSRSLSRFPRGKSHRQTEAKTTVGLYLPKTLVLKAKKHGLNLSRICEEALSSILTYMEAQDCETLQTESSKFLNRLSFQKESRARSSARLERQAHNLLVAGSSPAGPILST